LQRFAAETLPVSLCNEGADMVLADLPRIVDLIRLKEPQQLVEIPPVGSKRTRGQAAFVFQVGKKVVNVGLHTRSAYTSSGRGMLS
jgi:hypothetical protein